MELIFKYKFGSYENTKMNFFYMNGNKYVTFNRGGYTRSMPQKRARIEIFEEKKPYTVWTVEENFDAIENNISQYKYLIIGNCL